MYQHLLRQLHMRKQINVDPNVHHQLVQVAGGISRRTGSVTSISTAISMLLTEIKAGRGGIAKAALLESSATQKGGVK